MLKDLVDEIFKMIVSQNYLDSIDAIPHSDSFYKKVESNLGIDQKSYNKVMSILKESHKILTIEISKADEEHDLERIEGYVDADISTVKRLKEHFQRVLVDMYEEEYNQRLPVHQVIRELFPKMNRISKTPLGYIANKAIMLDEFEKLIEKEYTEYNEDWKAKKLEELLLRHESTFVVGKSKLEAPSNKKPEMKKEYERAVDSKKYNDFSKYSLNKVLQIYGVEFFFRINLRKYNFDYITELIERRKIDRKSDLKLLKEMIHKMKNNYKRDPKLTNYEKQIRKLDRTVSRFINLN